MELAKPSTPAPEAKACAGCKAEVPPVWQKPITLAGRVFAGGWDDGLSRDGKCASCEQAEDLARRDRDSCVAAAKTRSEWARALGGERAYSTFTLDAWKPAFSVPAEFPQNLSLYLHGPTGTGKTHLATAIGRAAVKFPGLIRVRKPSEIYRRVRACEDAAGEIEAVEAFVNSTVLVIDDLGIGRDTEFAFQTLYEIVDGRYMAMVGGLIVTSNLSLNELSAKLGDDRIPSRLASMCRVIHTAGSDKRVK